MNKKFIARTGEVNRRSTGGISSKEPGPKGLSSPAKQDDPGNNIVNTLLKACSDLPSSAKGKEQTPDNQQVIELLTKMSKQLETLEQTMKSPGGDNQQQPGPASQQIQPVNSVPGDDYQPADKSGGAMTNDSSPAVKQLQQILCNLLNKQAENPENPSGGQPANNPGTADNSTVQPEVTQETASQILANAQYELAGELETTLVKLRKIISDSEKIANKISSLLATNNR